MNNLFIFCCYAMTGSYAFKASWDENSIVEYDFNDEMFEPINNIKENMHKGTLDTKTSKTFIDYIEKASINTIIENIKKNKHVNGLEGYITDFPEYKVMHMYNNWFNTAYWYSGEDGTTIEQQKYLYLAMMLCDENAINFIYWRNEGENIDIPFEGKVRDFYFFDDNNQIIFIPNNINQVKYRDDIAYYEELKEKFADCFRKGYKIPKDSSDDNYWDLILINDNDEIFYYIGCKNDNPCMDKIIEQINKEKIGAIGRIY